MQESIAPPDLSRLWVPTTPDREIYDIYDTTIRERFRPFSVKPYPETREYLNPYNPLLQYDSSQTVESYIIDLIVTPESFEIYQTELDEYVNKHKLRSFIEFGGSIAFVTDHGQFTDVPITAEALGRLGTFDRNKTILSVSKMIALMYLDIGEKIDIIGKLRNISHVSQTVPRIEGKHSSDLDQYRRKCNDLGKQTVERAMADQGTILVESFIGRHNKVSKTGKTLFIHEPNKNTAERLSKNNILVVPVYVNCETFKPDGRVEPANMTFEFSDPIKVYDDLQVANKIIMQFFKDATSRDRGNKFEHVRIRSWRAQQSQSRFSTLINPKRKPRTRY